MKITERLRRSATAAFTTGPRAQASAGSRTMGAALAAMLTLGVLGIETGDAATAGGAADFFCTFESSPTDCGFFEQAKTPGRAKLVNVARDGAAGVRLHTEPGDTNVKGSGAAERNDLALTQADTGCTQGAEQWWSHSLLFPSDYVVPPDWGVVFDFHQTGNAGQANFQVDAASFGLRLRGYGGLTVDSGRFEVMLGPVVRNKWYDFVYHVRWSAGSDGFFDAWVDGKKVLSHRGPTLYNGMGCYLKLANYHTSSGQPSSVIHDRVVRGPSAEAVSKGPLEGVLDHARPDFYCTFEGSPTECGFHEHASIPGRAKLVNVSRDGTTSVRLHTEPGDTNVTGSGAAVRNDLMLTEADTGCTQGAEQWWSHSVLFPNDYVVPPDWGVVFAFHHTGSTGQANFHVDAASFGLRLRGYGGLTVDSGRFEALLGPVVRNKWYDFVYHVRWSAGSDGFFDAWVNGEKVLSHRGPTLYNGMGCYLKLANYHTSSGQPSSVIHDRVVRGSAPEAVSNGRLEGIEFGSADFRCTFESSPTGCGFHEHASVPGRAKLVNVSRDGTTGVRLHTEPGDTNVTGSGAAVRNDLMLTEADTGCTQGAEQWWSHSVLFPHDYVVPPDWGVVFAFHHTGSTGQANFHVDAASFGLRLRGYGGLTVDSGRFEALLGPVVRNKWYDFVYHVRWSAGSDGFFDAWVDGEKVLSHRGPTLYDGMGCYLKLANYHTSSGQPSSVIHDRVMRGSSAEAVRMGPLESVLELVDNTLTKIAP